MLEVSDVHELSRQPLEDQPDPDPMRLRRRRIWPLILLGLLGLVLWTVVIIGGWRLYARVSGEWNDYKAMKAILVYNLQQGRIVLPAPQGPPVAPAPQASPKPPEVPSKK